MLPEPEDRIERGSNGVVGSGRGLPGLLVRDAGEPALQAAPVRHAAAIALYFMCYNFGRIHQTLRVTPAMEAGLSMHVWDVSEIVALLDLEASKATKT